MTKKYLDDSGLDYAVGKIKTLIGAKQDTLTAGDNISIVNNVISASGGGSDIPAYYIETDKTYSMYDDDKDAGVYVIKNTSQSAINVFCASSSKYAKSIPAGKEGIIFVEDYSADKKRIFFFKGDELKNVIISSSGGGIYGSTSYVIPALLNSDRASSNSVLSIENVVSYTPTSDYHPATKKYVDDAVAGGGGASYTGGKFVDIDSNNVIDIIDEIHYSRASANNVGTSSSNAIDLSTLKPGKYLYHNNSGSTTFYYKFVVSSGDTPVSKSLNLTSATQFYNFTIEMIEDITNGISNIADYTPVMYVSFSGTSATYKEYIAYVSTDSGTKSIIWYTMNTLASGTISTEVSSLKTRMSSAETNISTNSGDISSLNTRVTALENASGGGTLLGSIQSLYIYSVNPITMNGQVDCTIDGQPYPFRANVEIAYNQNDNKIYASLYIDQFYYLGHSLEDVALKFTDDDSKEIIVYLGEYTDQYTTQDPLRVEITDTFNITSTSSIIPLSIYSDLKPEQSDTIKKIDIADIITENMGQNYLDYTKITTELDTSTFAYVENNTTSAVTIQTRDAQFYILPKATIELYIESSMSSDNYVINIKRFGYIEQVSIDSSGNATYLSKNLFT